ncbi:MAG: TIGR04255 family protein [Thermoplasmata archaeon]|nr:TIGR04255 family protein [Thermoplasmata archaeon]
MASESNHPVNQLDRVICQIRFPAVLEIDKRVDEFQKMIRSEYPRYSQSAPIPLNLLDAPIPVDHVFQSADSHWSINLSVAALSLTTTHYTNWAEFRRRFVKALDAVKELFEISECHRVGLRYINAIRPSSVGLNDPIQALRSPYAEMMSPAMGKFRSMNAIQEYTVPDDIFCRSIIGSIQFSNGDSGTLIDDDTSVEKTVSLDRVAAILDNLKETSLDVFKNIASDELINKVVS